MELMLQPLRKYADFEGRARRSEYWLFTLFLAVVSIILCVPLFAVAAANPYESEPSGLFYVFMGVFFLFGLATLIPSIAVTVRRLHDSDKSGWWYLISLVPGGGLVIFIFTLLDGTPGPNRFGADPKGRGVAGVFS